MFTVYSIFEKQLIFHCTVQRISLPYRSPFYGSFVPPPKPSSRSKSREDYVRKFELEYLESLVAGDKWKIKCDMKLETNSQSYFRISEEIPSLQIQCSQCPRVRRDQQALLQYLILSWGPLLSHVGSATTITFNINICQPSLPSIMGLRTRNRSDGDNKSCLLEK